MSDQLRLRRDELLRDIEMIRAKRREIIETGTSFSVSGGISQNQQTLKELAEEERRLTRQLNDLSGRRGMRQIDYIYGGS